MHADMGKGGASNIPEDEAERIREEAQEELRRQVWHVNIISSGTCSDTFASRSYDCLRIL